jgi:hypothetical protein
MKLLRLASLVLVMTFGFAGVAQAAPSVVRTAPPFVDGFYSENGNHPTTASIEFFVGDNGKLILGGQSKSAGGCVASAALVAEGVQNDAPIDFSFPRSIHISPSGAFSYTGVVTSTAEQTQSPVGASGTITISGHFVKGKIVAHRTNAIIGTFSAPSICAPSTPTRVIMQWDINDL